MNPRQFEAFLATHRPVLVSRAVQITGDRDTAEDVVQTTSVYLLANIHRYDPKRSALLTWVLGAVARRAFNAARARYRFVPANEAPDLITPGADIVYEQAQRHTLLATMTELLRDDPAFLLAEKIMAGHTVKEVAEAEGVAWESMNERLTWAFKRWRRLLAREFTRAEIETALGR